MKVDTEGYLPSIYYGCSTHKWSLKIRMLLQKNAYSLLFLLDLNTPREHSMPATERRVVLEILGSTAGQSSHEEFAWI